MLHEFTLTLKPFMYMQTAKDQYRMSKELLFAILCPYIKCSCIAELTKENNIHYHCMIWLEDAKVRDKFLNKFRQNKMWGRKSCSQIVDYDKWTKYLVKDLKATSEIIGDPIVYDYYGVAKMVFIPEGER